MGNLYIASGAIQTYRRNNVTAGSGVTVVLSTPFSGATEYTITVSAFNASGAFEPTYRITGKTGTQFTFYPDLDLASVEFIIAPVTDIV